MVLSPRPHFPNMHRNTMSTFQICAHPTHALPHTRVHRGYPVAARSAGESSLADHTAPLWPSKVPTQSPVSPRRSMGCIRKEVHLHVVIRPFWPF
jgi:hypothetical protein